MRNSNCPILVIFCFTYSISSWPTSGMMISTAGPYARIVISFVPSGSNRSLERADQLVQREFAAATAEFACRHPNQAACPWFALSATSVGVSCNS